MTTLGLSAKAPFIVKHRILADEQSLLQTARYGDPKWSNTSQEHRQKMRKKLYGDKRENRALANGYSEVGSLGENYADEKPPVWRSTFQSDFTPKRVHVDGQDINTEGSHYINLSNFEIRSHSSDVLPPMISSTQKDYISKQLLPVEKVRNAAAYPPIFRDENEIKSAHSVYNTTFVASNPPPLNIRRPDSITTHFELGDDLPVWSSVTRSNYRPHAPQTPVKIDSLDNRASTVLDNPDGQKEEMLSTKQSDYVIANDLDRRDLIVDNKATVKDLKSTHFTLGTVQGYAVKSQYQASFTQHPSGLRAETASDKLKGTFSSVKIEDGEEQAPNMSTHQSDFVSFEKRLDMIKQMKMSAQELKNAQTKSSISFGTDELPSSSIRSSITRKDFGALSLSTSSVPEVLKKHLRPGPVPAKRPVPAVTGPFTYSPIGVLDHPTGTSIMQSDYGYPAPAAEGDNSLVSALRSKNVARQRAKEFLCGTHFSFGSDEKGCGETTFQEHFGDPVGGEKAKKNWASVKDAGFDSTLYNTVTRYPCDADTYTTVNASVYRNHGKVPRPDVILPPSDTVGSCIAPDPNPFPNFLTSETKRTFIPPEAMVYMQPTAT